MQRNSPVLKEILCIYIGFYLFYAIVTCLKSYFDFSIANIVSLLMHIICSFLGFQLLFHMFSYTNVMSIVGSKAHKERMLYCYYVLPSQNRAYLI